MINLLNINSCGLAPDLAVVNAARASFLGDLKGEEKDKQLLARLVKDKHTSPLETVDLLFHWTQVDVTDLVQLLADSRFKLNATKGADGTWYIRIDVNNAIKLRELYRTNALALAIADAFWKHLPWLYEICGWGKSVYPVTYPQDQSVLKFQVGTDQWVELLSAPDQSLVEQLARKILAVKDTESADLLFARLYPSKMGDTDNSLLSLFTIQFRIHAPVVVWWQLVRHRMSSFSLQSGRYTVFKEDDFHLPVEWRKQSSSNKQGSDGVVKSITQMNLTRKLKNRVEVAFQDYTGALEDGVAKEQARFFLPGWVSLYTGIVKMDLLHFAGFLKLRLAPDAQHEIRIIAEAMYEAWANQMPIAAQAFKESLKHG